MTDHSGKKFVLALAVAVLSIWGLLYLAFLSWKSGYVERAARGRETASLVRALTASRPPDISVWQWEDTVDHAEAMLIAVTGSNLLSDSQMEELSVRVGSLVRSAEERPERSVSLLREFWDEVARRAGPIAEIYGRPQALRVLTP